MVKPVKTPMRTKLEASDFEFEFMGEGGYSQKVPIALDGYSYPLQLEEPVLCRATADCTLIYYRVWGGGTIIAGGTINSMRISAGQEITIAKEGLQLTMNPNDNAPPEILPRDLRDTCPHCEERTVAPGDYLCSKCRWGL